MEKKSRLLTIGQFAALHGINRKTLMWYDQIGLFQPAYIHPENGYRYYSYYQSSILETILLLRELDMSLEEIRAFLNQRSSGALEQLLGDKIQQLDRRIAHLGEIRAALSKRRKEVQALLSIDYEKIDLIECQPRALVTVEIDQNTPYHRQAELILEQTKQYRLRRLHDAAYGAMISVQALERGDFQGYSKLFLAIPFPIPEEGLHIRPGGRWARAFYRGPWDAMAQRYRELFAFLRQQGLEPYGWAYETVVNETMAQGKEDAIVQIELPVRPAPAD